MVEGKKEGIKERSLEKIGKKERQRKKGTKQGKKENDIKEEDRLKTKGNNMKANDGVTYILIIKD